MAKADFLTGLVLVGLGVYMIVEGLRLPGAGGFIEVGGEPGRVPILVGSAIVILAIVLVVRSVARGGHRLRGAGPLPEADRRGLVRCLGAAVLCSVYAVGLLGAEIGGVRIAYEHATFAFLLVFVIAFEWRFAPELAEKRGASLERRMPRVTAALARRLAWIPAGAAPYVWLVALAAVQAGIVTWAVTTLFEQQFFVKLP